MPSVASYAPFPNPPDFPKMAGNITILYCSFVCIDDGDVGPEIDRESFYDVFESFG